MNQLIKLISMSMLAPLNLLTILVSWIDLTKRASDTGIKALDTELAQVNAALDERATALNDKSKQLQEARKQRATASSTKRVADIKSDFE